MQNRHADFVAMHGVSSAPSATCSGAVGVPGAFKHVPKRWISTMFPPLALSKTLVFTVLPALRIPLPEHSCPNQNNVHANLSEIMLSQFGCRSLQNQPKP